MCRRGSETGESPLIDGIVLAQAGSSDSAFGFGEEFHAEESAGMLPTVHAQESAPRAAEWRARSSGELALLDFPPYRFHVSSLSGTCCRRSAGRSPAEPRDRDDVTKFFTRSITAKTHLAVRASAPCSVCFPVTARCRSACGVYSPGSAQHAGYSLCEDGEAPRTAEARRRHRAGSHRGRDLCRLQKPSKLSQRAGMHPRKSCCRPAAHVHGMLPELSKF
jgi:hypothetical protein